jgi:hypothetical protein
MQTNNPLLHQVLTALDRGRQTEALAWIDKLVAFMLEHERGLVFGGKWEPQLVRLLVAYHLAKGTLLVVQGEDGEPAAVLMYYVCNDDDGWEMVTDWQPDRDDGDCIWLAFSVSTGRSALGQLTFQLIGKEPRVLTHKLKAIRCKHYREPQWYHYDLRLFRRALEYRNKKE